MTQLINSIVVCDSITEVRLHQPAPPVVINGSHGGLAAAVFTIQKQVKGAIFNDAGVGKDRAGIAGLELLQQFGILAACVDAFSARIGCGAETVKGSISHMNRLAQDAGVRPGQIAQEAARRMAEAEWHPPKAADLNPPKEEETVLYTHNEGRRIIAVDSNSMIRPDHRNDVVLTGSHGGRVGNKPAVGYPVIAAFYNDAGVGKADAGISRLPWLQENGIVGLTVDANTARIGIGVDTYQNGVISAANPLGRDLGIKTGMAAKQAALLILKNMP